jgi:hypothetical protein
MILNSEKFDYSIVLYHDGKKPDFISKEKRESEKVGGNTSHKKQTQQQES